MADARTENVNELDSPLNASARRDFLKLAAMSGLGVFMPAVIAACNGDTTDPTAKASFGLGAPAGALNLIYAYTQFMADFYARVTSNKYVGMTAFESSTLSQLSTRQTNVRNTYQNLITAGRITDAVLFNFAAVDFSSRASVLGFAQKFEDLGSAIVNGLGTYLTNSDNLVLAAQVGSGFARNATVIRDLYNNTAGVSFASSGGTTVHDSFAATADSKGLDQAVAPNTAITTMQPYFRTTLSASGV